VPARHVLTILAVSDLARAASFYAAAFDWRRVVDAPVYVEHELPGGMRLGLYQREGYARNTGVLPSAPAPGAIAPTEIYLHVDDVAAACARLESAGARLLSPAAPRDWGDEAAYWADPDGNVLVVARPG
jgi:predicted enzyme related to lactoylglutathione lyase